MYALGQLAEDADDPIVCPKCGKGRMVLHGEFADDRYGAVGLRSAIPESRLSSFGVCPWRTGLS